MLPVLRGMEPWSTALDPSTGTHVWRLGLRVGERVRVRALEEILDTLDRQARLQGLPFMPEMAQRCGGEFTVLKRIDKVNDLVDRSGLRRMHDAVILQGDRCDGTSHGGCQQLCQSIWKEAWLERVDTGKAVRPDGAARSLRSRPTGQGCTEHEVHASCRSASTGEERFRCQQTEIRAASSYLAWWDPRQYFRDWRYGNASAEQLLRAFFFWLFSVCVTRIGGHRLLLGWYDAAQARRGKPPYPYRSGRLRTTPTARLDLRRGEWVRVKTFEEILDTLDTQQKNRGLWFDAEMVRYCGGTYRVLCRVERIIDPKSGRMLRFATDSIILEGVTSQGDLHRFYPQNEYPFWREIWLERC